MYYDVSKLIGKGTFASVYEAKSKNDNQVYAAKAFYKKVAFQDPKGRVIKLKFILGINLK